MVVERHFTARYSPEVTALAWLDEPVLDDNNNVIGRKHTFGSGISPVGFQVDFRPSHRVQPFLADNAGIIYFADRVLSPQGSQFMYTIDFGGGVNFHLAGHRAVTVGYRYQHLSNANISVHNPGTDADTFYVGFSQFHTPGVK
jgi:opacity protein-like surface antigen